MVHGCSGSPSSVWRGLGPLRSSPKRRRTRPRPKGSCSVIEERQRPGGGVLQRQLVLGAGGPLGGLDDALGEAASAGDDPQWATKQLRVGQLLPRPGVAVVVEDLGAGGLQLFVEVL